MMMRAMVARRRHKTWAGAALALSIALPLTARADDEKAERPTDDAGASALVLGVGADVGVRRFSYSDGLSANTRPYNVVVPLPALSLEVFPGARSTLPVLRDLGFVFSFAKAVGLDSATEGGDKLPTSWHRLRTGLVARLYLGDFTHDKSGPGTTTVRLTGSFDVLDFTYEVPTSDPLSGEVPAVSYKIIRVGVDVRLPFWRMALLASGGYQHPIEAGAVYERFREPSVRGADVGGGLAIKLGAGFEARAVATYTRFFSSFNPVPGDAYVAGGALDEFINVYVGAHYAY